MDRSPSDLDDRLAFVFPDTHGRGAASRWSHLDPMSENDRSILVRFDHPELGGPLDPVPPTTADDSPQLHLTLHEVAAAQVLGDDDYVWATVQRLLAAGHGRHDILHMIMHVAAEALYTVLTTDEPGTGKHLHQALDELPQSWLGDLESADVGDLAGLVDDWLTSEEPFDDEVADVIFETIHERLVGMIVNGPTTIDALTERFADELELGPADATAAIEMYVRWYCDDLAVSPSGDVAVESALTDDLTVRHRMTAAEAAAGRLEFGIDVAPIFPSLGELVSADGGEVAVSTRTLLSNGCS